jgi:rhamnosyltransferase
MPAERLSGSDVCAIAVTFHPDREFATRIARVLKQVGGLVIVDNGSMETERQWLRELAEDNGITIVLNLDNMGVASALNTGIQCAATRGFTWMLLLDQDSSVDEGMVQELLAVRQAYPDKEKIAVIGSGFRDVNKEAGREIAELGVVTWEEVKHVITSGSLIPLSVHGEVGPFREEFFIDYVDMEYCYRAKAKGFRILKTRKQLMSHAIGAYTKHRWLWKTKWTSNHSPDRRYYIARNDTVMLREYGNYRVGLWRLKSFHRCFKLCKRIALYERQKKAKIVAVVQGWWDGIHGHLGPRGSRWSA